MNVLILKIHPLTLTSGSGPLVVRAFLF